MYTVNYINVNINRQYKVEKKGKGYSDSKMLYFLYEL